MAGRKAPKTWYQDGLRFECTQCGECCSGPAGLVECTETEALEIVEFLGCGPQQFEALYARRLGEDWALLERERPETGDFDCVFLERSVGPSGGEIARCSIHPVRPQQCRTWPFWPLNLKSRRNWRKAGRSCEGIGEGRLYSAEEIEKERRSTPTYGGV